jgi:hypothetical protein
MSLDDKLATAVNSQNPKIKLTDNDDKKKSQSTLLIEIGKQFPLFHDDNMDAYAEITGNAVYPLRSKDFKERLSHHYFKLTDKGCNTNAVSDAINTLEAIAKHTGELHPVYIRTFNDAKHVMIDICDQERHVITVDASGWRVDKGSGVKFVCKRGMTSLPIPSGKGDINLLGKYLNINSDDLPLIIGWLFCAIGGVKPYPILILQGEQGSGKSTTSRVIRALVDPSSVPLRSPPREPKDLLVSAGNTHVVTLDNLSGLSPEISDCLCRLSTGGGHDVRQLYSDTDQILIDIQKPIIINGIDDIATRPDLAERSLIINLPEIKPDNRRSENEFWRDFDKDKAAIFSGLLDCLVSGLANRDSVVLKEKPRMADVAIWVTACENGYQPQYTFIDAHTKNQREAIELGIEASPVGTAIMTLMVDRGEWTGTPTELLIELERVAGVNQVKSRAWPQSAKGLKNSIKRLLPNFRKLGITITETRNMTARLYTITQAEIYPSYPSYVSYPTAGAASSHDTCMTHSEPMTDSMTVMTDSDSIRHAAIPATARVMTVMTDMTLKNDLPIFVDEGEI